MVLYIDASRVQRIHNGLNWPSFSRNRTRIEVPGDTPGLSCLQEFRVFCDLPHYGCAGREQTARAVDAPAARDAPRDSRLRRQRDQELIVAHGRIWVGRADKIRIRYRIRNCSRPTIYEPVDTIGILATWV